MHFVHILNKFGNMKKEKYDKGEEEYKMKKIKIK